jgi:putative ABC transport system permease protein
VSALRLSLRSLRREWRSGELRSLAAAVVIAVAAISSVGLFTDRVQRALELKASELLGADLAAISPTPPNPAWITEAQARGLRHSETVSFPSVVLAGERTRLAAVKAVAPGYPLRGRLRTSQQPYGAGQVTSNIPAAGTAWVDSRLAAELGLKPGSAVQVGAATLTVGAILTYEPDRGGDLFSIAPRLMMALSDLPRTRLIQPGSRVRYRVLVAGPPAAVRAYRAWLKPKLTSAQGLQDLGEARPQLRTALDRGRRFLGLAALVSVLLAGVAIAIAARRYAARHTDASAILRCLGAGQGWIGRLFVLQMTWMGLAAGAVGAALGYLAQLLLAHLLAGVVAAPLPTPGVLPAIAAVAAGLLALYAFALPPLLRLRTVPPLRVLRRDLGPLPPGIGAVYGSALAAAAALAVWQAGEPRLAAFFLAGSIATLLVLGVCAWLLVRSLGGLRRRAGAGWRFGLANVARRPGTSAAQVLGLGLGIMAVLLLTLIRNDLMGDWQRSLPPKAPNQFAINIQADQRAPLRSFFHSHGQPAPAFYPMVRGRLVAIDGKQVTPESYSNPRAQRLAAREFNLSWAARPQADNRVTSGRWWSAAAPDRHQFSVESGIAETLGIHLGDRLTYQVAGQRVEGTVTSLRQVDWDSFHPNFFVVAPPGLLDGYPATWICSFYLPSGQDRLLSELVRAFPNITVIDVAALMSEVRGIMDRVARAVEFVFVFTLLAGAVVLAAAIQATHDERRLESAILRTLGARRGQLRLGLAAEFVSLGLLAGLLGAMGATVVAWLIAHQLLDLSLQIRPIWWLAGMFGGGLGVGLAGLLGTRAVLNQPPLETLRRL